jgi:predicted site-specific integrase-resolvase|tara:strand:- start:262 stop:507 length:246 start_codon:yes stop_codon:yes gene_type:complete
MDKIAEKLAETMTVKDAASILNISLVTAYEWCKTGKMPGAFRPVNLPKHRWFINKDIFDTMLDTTRMLNQYEKAQVEKMVT